MYRAAATNLFKTFSTITTAVSPNITSALTKIQPITGQRMQSQIAPCHYPPIRLPTTAMAAPTWSLPTQVTIQEISPILPSAAKLNPQEITSVIDQLAESGLTSITASYIPTLSRAWMTQNIPPGITPTTQFLSSNICAISTPVSASKMGPLGKEQYERLEKLRESSRLDLPIQAVISDISSDEYPAVSIKQVAELAKQLRDMGFEITLEIPGEVSVGALAQYLEAIGQQTQLPDALRISNSHGQGVANLFLALQIGIQKFESSIAGLDKMLATEDLLYQLQGFGIKTANPIHLQTLAKLSQTLSAQLGVPNYSSVANALNNNKMPIYNKPKE